jgi:CBS domain-containing protein
MGWERQTAATVMTSPVKAVELGATLEEVVQRLVDEAVTGVLVTDRAGRPKGVVSHADVLAYVAGVERGLAGLGQFYFPAAPLTDRVSSGPRVNLSLEDEDALRETTVDQVMTPEVISVPATAPLSAVARTMVERRIHRVLVEDEGAIVGIVSTLDVLGAVSTPAPRRAKKKAAATKKAKKAPRPAGRKRRTASR